MWRQSAGAICDSHRSCAAPNRRTLNLETSGESILLQLAAISASVRRAQGNFPLRVGRNFSDWAIRPGWRRAEAPWTNKECLPITMLSTVRLLRQR
jgi:hypothetical protein